MVQLPVALTGLPRPGSPSPSPKPFGKRRGARDAAPFMADILMALTPNAGTGDKVHAN
jgi:hypothetical protein